MTEGTYLEVLAKNSLETFDRMCMNTDPYFKIKSGHYF